MNTFNKVPYHIARRVGQQGARCSVGDQACNEKCTTGRKHIQLRNEITIGTWNLRKLKEKGKLSCVCIEMSRCGLQILGISETNWNGSGNFKTNDKQMVIYSGKEDNYSHGVAIILGKEASNSLIGYSPITDRILKVRIQAKPHNVSILQCYAPTSTASDEQLENFYNSLQEAIDTIPNRDIKIIMGDMNAKIGKVTKPTAACGIFGLRDQNERGERLHEFCIANNLSITNTMFKHHPHHLYTWTSPDSRTRNQIDYIIMNQKWRASVKNVKTRPSADCNSDHQLLVAKFQLRLRNIEQPPQLIRFNCQTLHNNYIINVCNSFEALLNSEEEKEPNDLWQEGKRIFLEVAKKTISQRKATKNRWITEATLKEVEVRRKVKSKGIRDPVQEAIYKEQNSKIRRMMRKDKEQFVEDQCKNIEENAMTNSTRELFNGVRSLTRKFRPAINTIKNEAGVILCDREHVKDRWREYCSKVYKKNENLTTHNTHWNDSTSEPPPIFEEVKEAIKELKVDKSPGNDEVTAEMIKNGGENVEKFFHRLCTCIWH